MTALLYRLAILTVADAHKNFLTIMGNLLSDSYNQVIILFTFEFCKTPFIREDFIFVLSPHQ